MSNLYDSETDGNTGSEMMTVDKKSCDFCGGSGIVVYAPSGFDIEYQCPRCNK
jgi:hypothetical protein